MVSHSQEPTAASSGAFSAGTLPALPAAGTGNGVSMGLKRRSLMSSDIILCHGQKVDLSDKNC